MLTYCEFLPKNTPNVNKQKKVFCQNCPGAHCPSDCVEHASSKISPPSPSVSHWPLHHSIPHRAPFHQISPFIFAVPHTRRGDILNLYGPCFPPSFPTGYCQRWTPTRWTSGLSSGAPSDAPHNSIISPAVTTQPPKHSS